MTSALMCLFGFSLLLAQSYDQFCWLRCLLGFAIGGGLSVDFVYFIECIPAKNRSFRTSFIILIGILGRKSRVFWPFSLIICSDIFCSNWIGVLGKVWFEGICGSLCRSECLLIHW